MSGEAATGPDGREAFISAFRWANGHADVWAAFQDAMTLRAVVAGLAEPSRHQGVTAVAGVEARGFLLGGAVAVQLGVGFHAVRKGGALFPGPKLTATAGKDYRGYRHDLSIQVGLARGSRVLVVDDWAERGSQAMAAKTLIERSGAQYAGLAVIVDQLSDKRRQELAPVVSLVSAEDLGDPES